MKKILAATIGLTAFVAFAFQSPKSKNEVYINDEPLKITLEGIEDGQIGVEYSNDFLSEIE